MPAENLRRLTRKYAGARRSRLNSTSKAPLSGQSGEPGGLRRVARHMPVIVGRSVVPPHPVRAHPVHAWRSRPLHAPRPQWPCLPRASQPRTARRACISSLTSAPRVSVPDSGSSAPQAATHLEIATVRGDGIIPDAAFLVSHAASTARNGTGSSKRRAAPCGGRPFHCLGTRSQLSRAEPPWRPCS